MLSVWPAIVPALAALAGVALGQVLQGRRDLAQHKRDIQVELLRSMREDRTRFMEERRQVYADFLAKFDQCEPTLTIFQIASEAGSAPEDQRLGGGYPSWVTKEHDERYEALCEELGRIHTYLELIAPDDVIAAAFEAWDTWDSVGRRAMYDDYKHCGSLRKARTELVNLMKADLDAPMDPKFIKAA